MSNGDKCALKEVNLKMYKTQRLHLKEVNILVLLLINRKEWEITSLKDLSGLFQMTLNLIDSMEKQDFFF